MRSDTRPVFTPRLVLGVFLSILGILLALDNADLLEARQYLRYWPSVLIVMGAVMVGQSREGSGSVGGMILIAAGGWLLLNTLDVIDIGLWDVFWPLVLILVGANLIRQTLRRTSALAAHAETVSLLAVLSGVQRSSQSKAFQGGEMFAFMGGCDLDLRQAAMPPGAEAVIDCFAMMGGLEIRVPPGWAIEMRVLPIMGGIEENTTVVRGDASLAAPPKLVLRGMLVMGGLELKN